MPTPDDLRLYEAMFLVDTGDAASWDDMTKNLQGILTRAGADLIGITRWDERKLAYTVGKHKRGTYVLAFFAMGKEGSVTQIERDCQLSEKVARLLILRADHFKVADMRVQLGEDVNEEVAARITALRGETEPEAATETAEPKPAARPAPAGSVRAEATGQPGPVPAEPSAT